MMKAWLELDAGTRKKTRREKDPEKTWLYADSVNWTRLARYYLHGANSVLSIASSHNGAEAQKKMTRIGTKQDVNRVVKMLKSGGFRITKNPEHIQAFDGDDSVYRAMKKNSAVWVVWYNDKYFA